MTGSNLALSVLMDHAGVIRRSDEELSETTCSGTSAIARGCACCEMHRMENEDERGYSDRHATHAGSAGQALLRQLCPIHQPLFWGLCSGSKQGTPPALLATYDVRTLGTMYYDSTSPGPPPGQLTWCIVS